MVLNLRICFLIVVGLGSVLSLNEAQMKAGVKLVRNTCRSKTKITDEQIEKMHQGIWDDDDEVTKCYVHCCLGMMKMQTKSGGFDRALADKQIPQLPDSYKVTLVKSFDNCINAGEGLTKKCDLAYAFFKCVYFDDPEHYILP